LPIILTEAVQHIHLGNEENPLAINKIQFYQTSDIHLVYCQGALDENCYLLMTILSPDAHKQARTTEIMFKLGVMAERFRKQFKLLSLTYITYSPIVIMGGLISYANFTLTLINLGGLISYKCLVSFLIHFYYCVCTFPLNVDSTSNIKALTDKLS
jgi:mRNA interferase YafO